MGGEKKGVRHWWALPRGSPPRGRGKVHRLYENMERMGITPAWAGKRSQVAAALQSGWDHPRVGGEKQHRQRKNRTERGSPPRRRGKGVDRKIALLRYGITPAWAGKRVDAGVDLAEVEDHPRVGGEKGRRGGRPHSPHGSPPAWAGKSHISYWPRQA